MAGGKEFYKASAHLGKHRRSQETAAVVDSCEKTCIGRSRKLPHTGKPNGKASCSEKANGKTSSVIFLDGGEHIIQYSFSNTDIADNDGFCDMVNSAAYFTNGDSKVVEFHGNLFNTGDLSKETIEWLEWYNSLSPEDQLAISSVPADLYTYDSSGAVDEVAGE